MIGIGARGTTIEITRLTRWEGEGKIAKTLAVVSVLGALVLLIAPWRQNAVGSGRVIAFSANERQLEVQAPVKGRVVRWHHQEGDIVRAGEIIVELADNDAMVLERYRSQRRAVVRRVEAAKASVDALARKIEALERERALTLSSAAAQIEVAETKARAAALELEAAEAQERTATLQLRRLEDLADEGLTSQRDLEVARRNAASARAATLKARAGVDGASSEVDSKRAERRSKGSKLTGQISAAEEKLQSARAKRAKAEEELETVERELARQNSLDVRTPRSGMLVSVRAREGSAFVQQGETLATIIPHADQRAVELSISGLDAPLVVPGQDVQLQFEGWPAIQIGGWPEAAVGTFSGKVSFVEAQATARGRFRVVVVPNQAADWPDAKVLRQGNLAYGWILLQKVPLGYELWRQLNGFPPDLPPEAARASGLKKTKAREPKN